MGATYAELHVAGRVFVLRRCTYGVSQATGPRGRPIQQVVHHGIDGEMDVPRDPFLEHWAAESYMPLDGWVTFSGGPGEPAIETVSWTAGHCVLYREVFNRGSITDGSYICQWRIVAAKLVFSVGPPAPFVAPAPREHGTPPVAALLGAAVGGASPVPVPDVPPHLPAPVPVPSPDHKQLHVTAAEWQAITAGRWDRENNKKFFKKHRSTEFHVAGDPFTYRTDDKGKVVAVYDAQKSYNIIGTRKGVPGVPLTLNAQPTFAGTPYMYPPGPPHLTVVEIKMKGSREKDFREANEKAGLLSVLKAQGRKPDEAPDGFTWHHRDDFKANPNPPPVGSCTMELVDADAHVDTFVHRGSCDQCNKHVGKKLYK